jgi:hypothetical protein
VTRRSRRKAAAVLVVGSTLLGGAVWLVFASAATLTVAPKNASAFQTCVLTGYPTTSAVVSDSWVDEQSKNANKKNTAALQVTSQALKNTRAYLRFDLTKCAPAIATSATVKQAVLRLSLSVAPAAPRTYGAYRVTTPCPEATTTCWTEAGTTWASQPSVLSAATSTLGLTSSSALQYFAWDVTADVAALVAGTAANYGWRIADVAEGNATAVTAQFRSKNASGDAAGAPELVIVHSP